MRIFLFLFCILSRAAFAEDPKVPAPAPAAVSSTMTYELRDLRPLGISQYGMGGEGMRQYLEFQNGDGTHHLVYEELPTAPPNRLVGSVRTMATAFDSVCTMDIECGTRAFCTADCKHLYYEVANVPGDALSPDRNKCKVLYFSCEKFVPPSLPAGH